MPIRARALMAITLSFSLLIAGVGYRTPQAAAAGTIVEMSEWDSRADFERNASSTGEIVALTGLSTNAVNGAVMLDPSGITTAPVVAVSAGGSHTVALLSNGTAAAVGDSDKGQCEVLEWKDLVAVSAGPIRTLGLRADGTVVTTTSTGEDQKVLPGFTDVAAISVGDYHDVGLRSNGTAVSSGSNSAGQCDVSGWTDLVAVSAGSEHTVGLRSNGTVVATGDDWYGQCRVSGWTDIVAVSAASNHTVGLRSDGTVVATGDDWSGQSRVSNWTGIVAISTSVGRTLGLRSDGTVVAAGATSTDAVSGWADVIAVSAGGLHAVALTAEGAVLTDSTADAPVSYTSGWVVDIDTGGYHVIAVRSDGTASSRGRELYGVTDVSGWTGIISASAGADHSVGLRADGTAVAVGYNQTGACEVSSWTELDALDAGHESTIGLRSDGTALATGRNDYGECDVQGWTDLIGISAGNDHTLGLHSDGTAVAVGNDHDGRCDVSAWTDLVAVAAGGRHSVGLRRDGTVVAVGDEWGGSCDVDDWTGVVAIDAGGSTTIGLRYDGTVLATGPSEGLSAVSQWNDIIAVSAGLGSVNALRADGTALSLDGTSGYAARVSGMAFERVVGASRSGSIGGAGRVGLRAERSELSAGLKSALGGTVSSLAPGSSVKVAARVSDDGVTWTEPLGRDGEPVDWTDGTGTYFGSACGDFAWHDSLDALPPKPFVDLEVRMASGSAASPVLRAMSIATRSNMAPRAADDTVSCVRDESVAVDVLANDADADGDALWATIVTRPEHGTLTQDVNGALSYAPVAGYLGSDSFTYRAYDGELYSSVATASIEVVEPPMLPAGFHRVAGLDRYETSAATSQLGFPGGAKTVVLATGEDWPDALGGSSLAGAVEGPLLLTRRTAVPDVVLAEIDRLGATKAYILGGTGAVSAEVEDALKARGLAVTRKSGISRLETARAVAAETIMLLGDSYDGRVFVVTNLDFPDATGAAPLAAALGRPIVLADVRMQMIDLPARVSRATILGGTGVISQVMEDYLEHQLGPDTVDRLGGVDRYETAALVARAGTEAGMSSKGVGLATGLQFADALSGGAMLGQYECVMLLTRPQTLPESARLSLNEYRAGAEALVVFGGEGAVSRTTEATARACMGL